MAATAWPNFRKDCTPNDRPNILPWSFLLNQIRLGLIARQHAWRLFAYSVFLCVFVCVRTVRGVHARFKVREVQAGPRSFREAQDL